MHTKNTLAVAALALFGVMAGHSGAHGSDLKTETYIREPMPRGFRVEATELDGPVFADASGKTLYRWPRAELRNGLAGDNKGQSECSDTKTTVNTGFMSPYPEGLLLPELDQRPACTAAWPPASAPADAKPVGQWTIIVRRDGIRQWARDGYPLYTSRLDHLPGDVLGGTSRRAESGLDSPVGRKPVGPSPDVPPGFTVVSTAIGRLLVGANNLSVYVYDADGPNASHCDDDCSKTWIPVPAPEVARPHGDWSILERSSGIRQWAFRKRPLYRYALDYAHAYSVKGADVPGWHNVYTQRAPAPPGGFTVQDTTIGQVLADASGMTIYRYGCGDDATDQLACDHPTETQAYRLAMCGGGEPERCLRTFPYVIAGTGARSSSRAWTIVSIDPVTGRLAGPGRAGAVQVWAYRDRPVYTYAGDRQPGDTHADSHGEMRGQRNGYKAFWLRDDFYGYETY